MSRYPLDDFDSSEGEDFFKNTNPTWFTKENYNHNTNYEDYLAEVFEYIIKGDQDVPKEIKARARHYQVDDNYLYHVVTNHMVKIPYKNERLRIIKECHDGQGHFGQEATWKWLYNSY